MRSKIPPKKSYGDEVRESVHGCPGRGGTFTVYALGCRVNQEEMECLRSQLLAAGYKERPFGDPVDLTIINTCTVTAAGDRDGRKLLRKARRFSPQGRIVATGCTAQRDPGALDDLQVADLILGNREKGNLALYRGLLADPSPEGETTVPATGILVDDDPSPQCFLTHAPGFSTARTRATLKIQDGCNGHCTYCIIPAVRGPSISRPWKEILSEAGGLIARGAREIVLTGINTGSYGWEARPGAETDLASLAERLAGLAGLERIRLASVEPGYVTPRLLDLMTRMRSLCPHLHVPLQSGDDEILKRMGRPYRTGEFADLVRRIRAVTPRITLGTDIIVGFPGETEDHFRRTLCFVKEQDFSYLHVFSYSPRPGTPAERLEGTVADGEKTRRSRLLRDLDSHLRRGHMALRKGSQDRILVESSHHGAGDGLTADYLRVVLNEGAAGSGEMMDVVIGEPVDDHHVRGIIPHGM
ncbi:MAG: tRNA (N(6)-L-threonylcarbamoyladenosine(37)-C(2))-methylthiotransferase MtaB [Candidatus Eisenbacteria bacterium]|uniref:tRNA (N(6)-L-threonylcarbamoyladenosine(37)-C(2))-methylthiotransferase MtaB n=1 Tax=Eiseniibacteriota bacterium TaxID=2212470 RepID=A0A948RR06_UNCEI|nr:tRNA (N(6)-L-threonylcarbamoyladenosine(37)-C(2))-methylthiotransferase MtaB [Candidatus Eisenbacteria bacterium]MBU1948634.1 tRNA (N(6)-L-threonylcarbamoyladenosine(37)-C(2))-methylthiotransferase MtaB [Candidatus Eisenbacteria bacterium]MBU2689390.1 tRNA (N(6)-L-threonylcarbamoyladenosine(37)-C(2))-methylthiotransferase MtaB [Candidatus Eisenbacteria bacterium]